LSSSLVMASRLTRIEIYHKIVAPLINPVDDSVLPVISAIQIRSSLSFDTIKRLIESHSWDPQ